MTAILGMRGTGDFGATGQRAESWEEKILWKNGDTAKLTTLLAMLPKHKAVTDKKYHWFEEDLPSQRLRINNGAGYVAGDTLMTVDTESATNGIAGAFQIRKGQILWNERSGERMYVSDDPVSDTQIQVTRGFGTTAAAAVVDNDWLTTLGTTHAEYADTPTSVGYTPEEVNNITQIFRESWTMSGTAIETEFRTGDEYKNARRRAGRDYALKCEWAFLLGEYLNTTDPVSGLPLTQTRGIIPHIAQYAPNAVKSAVGALSEAQWDEYLEQLSRDGMFENKIMLAGGTALRVFETMAKAGNIQMRSDPKTETYGMAIRNYMTSFGELKIAEHKLFSQHPVMRQNALIVDTEFIQEVPMKGRDTKCLKDRQGNGVDGKTDEFLGEKGLKVKYAKAHMYLTGITSFAP